MSHSSQHPREDVTPAPEQPQGHRDAAHRTPDLEHLRGLGDAGVPLADVARLADLHRYSVTRLEAQGKFPPRLSTRRRPHYRASEVRAWLIGTWGQSKFFASARRHAALKIAGRSR